MNQDFHRDPGLGGEGSLLNVSMPGQYSSQFGNTIFSQGPGGSASGGGGSVFGNSQVPTGIPTTPGVGMSSGAGIGSGGLIGGLSAKEIAALGMLAMQFFQRTRGSGAPAGSESISGPLNDILGLQASQARRQDPLHQAVTQLAMNLLPNSAFGAGPNRPVIG